MRSPSPRTRPCAGGEDGFSLVEVLAAALLLLVGILGTAASLNHSRDVVSSSEVREAAAHRAQRELERIRALPYASIGLTTAPAPSSDPASPDAAVRSGGQYQWHAGDTSKVEPLVLGGSIPPVQTFEEGRLKARMHVYVTAYDDPQVAAAVGARRVTVVIVPTGAWKLRAPVVASTVVPAQLP